MYYSSTLDEIYLNTKNHIISNKGHLSTINHILCQFSKSIRDFQRVLNPNLIQDPLLIFNKGFNENLILFKSVLLSEGINEKYISNEISKLKYIKNNILPNFDTPSWRKCDDLEKIENLTAPQRLRRALEFIRLNLALDASEKDLSKGLKQVSFCYLQTKIGLKLWDGSEVSSGNRGGKIRKWISGKVTPRFSSCELTIRNGQGKFHHRDILVKIETLSGVPKGFLTDVFPDFKLETLSDNVIKVNRQLNVLKFTAKELTLTQRQELHSYFLYKTKLISNLDRNGKWLIRYLPTRQKEDYGILEAKSWNKMAYLDCEKYIPSAGPFLAFIREYWSFLISKFDIKIEDMSLYLCANSTYVESYVEYLLNRRNGYIHKQDLTAITCLSALVRPSSSYLIQVNGYHKLNISLDELKENLKNIHGYLCEVKKAINSNDLEVRSRFSTKEVYKNILDLPDPSAYVLDAISKAQLKLLPLYKNNLMRREDLADFRNLVLVSCLLCNPLRRRNWSMMKICGNLNKIYKDTSSIYRIFIQKSEFKNWKFMPNYSDSYNVSLPKWCSDFVDIYMKDIRNKILKGKESEFFLVSYRLNTPDIIWASVFVKDFFNKFGDKSISPSGCSIHLMRDIVATSYLRKNPNAFQMVAYLLNDSLDTILQHYGHLKFEDSFKIWGNQLDLVKIF